MNPVCWLLLSLVAICLLVALAAFLVGSIPHDQSTSSEKDPLHNIPSIGREARREMDRISDDFVHRQVKRKLKKRKRRT